MNESRVTLRQARPEDLDFLFMVSTEAMRPVVEALHSGEVRDVVQEREKYAATFRPEAIQIVQYDGQDVGRLRVVRNKDSIYVGGIQLLPAFQSRGIGTYIFEELKREADSLSVPITLEVHEINEGAMAFYIKLGFVAGERVGHKRVMRYN